VTVYDTDKNDDMTGQDRTDSGFFAPGGIEVRSTHGPDKWVCITKSQKTALRVVR
jgi:hypothetical protein